MPTTRHLYVNLAVADLPRSTAFFAALGFEFHPRFTNESAACMIMGDRAHVMLLARPFFARFTPRPICDTAQSVEALLAFDAPSRAGVDAIVDQAIEAGAREARDPEDQGFMYHRSFFDLDGHQWEVLWMDEAAVSGSAA